MVLNRPKAFSRSTALRWLWGAINDRLTFLDCFVKKLRGTLDLIILEQGLSKATGDLDF